VVNIQNQYLDPIGNTIGQYRVDKIDYDVSDPITLQLWWGGVPTRFLNLAGRGLLNLGKWMGGLQNTEAVNVRDGRILATTIGYSAGIATFSIVMWLVKQEFGSLPAGFHGYILMETGDFILMENGLDRILME
jgi:hypothetical protein